jgi:hypothetical protein
MRHLRCGETLIPAFSRKREKERGPVLFRDPLPLAEEGRVRGGPQAMPSDWVFPP